MRPILLTATLALSGCMTMESMMPDFEGRPDLRAVWIKGWQEGYHGAPKTVYTCRSRSCATAAYLGE